MPSAYRNITGVALRTVRYNDSRWLLTVWTRQYGRMSLTVNAGNSKESRRRRALTMPMCTFEAVAAVKPGMEVVPVRDMRPHIVYQEITANPVKSSIAMFMAEVLNSLLRESNVGDEATWNAILNFIKDLDKATDKETAIFPLWFMIRLAAVMGISPDTGTYHPGFWLDLTDGIFRAARPLPPHKSLDPTEARVANLLVQRPLHQLARLPLKARYRRDALETILQYYGMHLQPLTSLRTLPVLHTLLH